MDAPIFPVHRACMDGDLLTVKQELNKLEIANEQEEDPSKKTKFPLRNILKFKDADGRTILHWCISMKHEHILDFLLEKYNANKIDIDDLFDDAGWNPLHVASNTSVDNVKKLFEILKIKPDVDKKTLMTLSTPLHISCSKIVNYPIIEYLITEQGASVRIKDKRGRLPIHIASCIENSMEIIKLLCDNKSPVNTRDTVDGWTPLHHAMSEGNLGVAILLVQEYDADYKTITSNDGQTPLDVSVSDNFKQLFLQSI